SSAPRTTPGASANSRGATAGAKAANSSPPTSSIAIDREWLSRLARRVRLEIVEPARALPLLSPADYRRVDAYAQVYELPRSGEPERAPFRVSSRRALGLLGRIRSRAATLLGAADDGADANCSSSSDRTL